jgi:hypothetical protein
MPAHAHHTAAQIIEVACRPVPTGFEHPEFRDLILRIAGDRGQPSSKSLGRWLTKINGRVVDDKRLEMSSDAKRGNRYKLVSSKVTTAASAPSKNATKPVRRGLFLEADESTEW